MAKFKIDENLPVEVAEMLKAAGDDAMTILDQSMVGELDPKVASVCKSEGRALVTLDLDFSDIRTYPPAEFQASSCCVLETRQIQPFWRWSTN
ncbi:MAG: DUF5615 family PIN-like protein [Spirochaetales bacterium]|jgi:predicted nuclease of predicted toxin-antitoxin system|nr:DUF5615 family PIN-like protein [Spirochaetales bacterium]